MPLPTSDQSADPEPAPKIYVGASARPRPRLLQHRRQPTKGVAEALAATGLTTEALLYVPILVCSRAAASVCEAEWTNRLRATMNASGVAGNPACQRRFWQWTAARRAQQRH